MTIQRFAGPYQFLSNFHPSPFRFTAFDRQWMAQTNEHFYQAMKAAEIKDFDYVLRQPTPGRAKRAGRAVAITPDWNASKIAVMRIGLKAKFDQNLLLRDKLLATGSQRLVEGNNWGDTFWGVCHGLGSNHLGRLLMLLRDHYREELAHEPPNTPVRQRAEQRRWLLDPGS